MGCCGLALIMSGYREVTGCNETAVLIKREDFLTWRRTASVLDGICCLVAPSPSQRPLPDNTQHSQQTDIHRTPLDEWSARHRDLYLTTHNTHNRQTSIGLLWTSDQPVTEISTWQHTTLTTDTHPQDSPLRVISPLHRPLPDNTQHSQQKDIHRTPLYEWSARRRDLHLTTHNTHNRQTSIPPVGFEPTVSAGELPQTYALDRAATGTGL